MIINSAGRYGQETVAQFVGDISEIYSVERIQASTHRAADPPSFIQLLADALEWSNILKLVATAYLSKIAAEAAKDTWANKAKVGIILADVTIRPLRILASSIAKTIRKGINHNFRLSIGLPIPDDYWGTCLWIDKGDEELVTWMIANFVVRSTTIEEFVKREMLGPNRPLAGFFVEILEDGAIKIVWKAESDFSIHEHIIR